MAVPPVAILPQTLQVLLIDRTSRAQCAIIHVAVRIGEKRIRRYRKEDIEKFLQDGAPGVLGRKFTVHPSALDFTDLSSPGDQKGYPKAAPFRPAKSRLLAHV
jgi:hypothetical protein